jgi:hypothetical protein
MHHRRFTGPDLLKATQPQELVQVCVPQRGHRSGAIAQVAMGFLLQLGFAYPVPALNALAGPHVATVLLGWCAGL